MFAFFNLGIQELIILGVLALMLVGVVAAVVLVIVFSSRGRSSEDE